MLGDWAEGGQRGVPWKRSQAKQLSSVPQLEREQQPLPWRRTVVVIVLCLVYKGLTVNYKGLIPKVFSVYSPLSH